MVNLLRVAICSLHCVTKQGRICCEHRASMYHIIWESKLPCASEWLEQQVREMMEKRKTAVIPCACASQENSWNAYRTILEQQA